MNEIVPKPIPAAPILIIDDEPDICWSLSWILRHMGHHTIEASSGQQALALAAQSCFQMAFVDAKLPDFEGIELSRQLCQLQPGLPIVIISGYFFQDDPSVQVWKEHALICDFISKPFLLGQVRDATLRASSARRA